jgi:hypothetical protein
MVIHFLRKLGKLGRNDFHWNGPNGWSLLMSVLGGSCGELMRRWSMKRNLRDSTGETTRALSRLKARTLFEKRFFL